MEGWEKKFDEHFYINDPECEHGFLPAVDCPNLLCSTRILMKEYGDLKSFINREVIETMIADIDRLKLWTKGTAEGTRKDIQHQLKARWLPAGPKDRLT